MIVGVPNLCLLQLLQIYAQQSDRVGHNYEDLTLLNQVAVDYKCGFASIRIQCLFRRFVIPSLISFILGEFYQLARSIVQILISHCDYHHIFCLVFFIFSHVIYEYAKSIVLL